MGIPMLTPEENAAEDVAERWQRWIDDPDKNAPPNPKAANVARLKEWKARAAMPPGLSGLDRAKAHLRAIDLERENDPEPNRDTVAHLQWSQRETMRLVKSQRHQVKLDDYTP